MKLYQHPTWITYARRERGTKLMTFVYIGAGLLQLVAILLAIKIGFMI